MQNSFSDLGYAAKKKLTRRDRFLAEFDGVTAWSKLHKLVESFYPEVVGSLDAKDKALAVQVVFSRKADLEREAAFGQQRPP